MGRGFVIGSQIHINKAIAVYNLSSGVIIKRDGRSPHTFRELFQMSGVPQLRIPAENLRNMIPVIYVGIDRVPDAV